MGEAERAARQEEARPEARAVGSGRPAGRVELGEAILEGMVRQTWEWPRRDWSEGRVSVFWKWSLILDYSLQ